MRDIACERCGSAIVGGRCPACEFRAESRFVRREFVVLIVLGAVTVSGFLLTRAAARANHDLRLRDGSALYAAGERDLGAGHPASAIDALRRAVAIERDNQRYRLALSSALEAAGQDDAARQVLVGIRQLSPENPEANLRLARIEGRQGDAAAAIRYYQSALYGTWGAEQQDRRREVRVEFVHYLLTHDDRALALSELLILSGNLPDQAALHVEAGSLFNDAGDPGRALDQFRRALRLDPGSRPALAGAGESAFELGDYVVAQRFLRAATQEPSDPQFDRLSERLQVADLVLARDPLLPRLSPRDRRDRLMSSVAYTRTRLTDCLASGSLDQAQHDALDSLRAEIDTWQEHGRNLRDGSVESIETGLNLVYRIERQTAGCGPLSPVDRALQLIAHRHEIDRQ
jgi:tetratricopeptide (TPR) repeat protein